MKKNITINLFGSLHAIDEDAYELLKTYEDNLRAYFLKQEGGDEIVDDIEHRIAELLEELKAEGKEAVEIEQIQDIIRRIGKPEQMETDDKGDEEAEPVRGADKGYSPKKKRLFRDPSDTMLGGVMSGLSHYFGGDVLFWRLLIIILCLFTKLLALPLYIVCWIIIPKARTAEDFLLMNGKSVTADNIGQTVVNGQNDNLASPVYRTGFNRFLAFCIGVLKVCLYSLGAMFFIVCVLLCISALVILVIGIVGTAVSSNPLAYIVPEGNWLPNISSIYFWIFLTFSLICFGIPVYCFVHHVMRLRKSVAPMSLLQRLLWVAAWLFAVVVIAITGVSIGVQVEDANHKVSMARYDGNDSEWDDFINEINGEDGLDSLNIKYVCYNDLDGFTYEYLANNVRPGLYRLRIQTMADRPGCVAFVQRAMSTLITKRVPFGSPGRVQTATSSSSNDSLAVVLPEVIMDSIPISGGDVHFGIRMKEHDYPVDVNKCDHLLFKKYFQLERVGDLPQASTKNAGTKPKKKSKHREEKH